MTVWCRRCSRRFGKYSALRQHVRDSQNHYECNICQFDGETWDELLDHARGEQCGIVCQGCDGGLGEIWSNDGNGYWEHVKQENVCMICDRHFENPNNLRQHEISHRQKNVECYRCNDTFKTYGGMASSIV
ncbi:unnamed protein product [Periconia digitata]|uniref:C2H2-type domain-containing protein n=1 Tax=Periconia digitata TaxID=1303443 RepID=A0A9W4UQ66_9PLEO|nr:unnamed protein product [Periconia digitata]